MGFAAVPSSKWCIRAETNRTINRKALASISGNRPGSLSITCFFFFFCTPGAGKYIYNFIFRIHILNMHRICSLLDNKLFKPEGTLMMLTNMLSSKWKQQESGFLVLLGMSSWTLLNQNISHIFCVLTVTCNCNCWQTSTAEKWRDTILTSIYFLTPFNLNPDQQCTVFLK
jgi:hypothetical protein